VYTCSHREQGNFDPIIPYVLLPFSGFQVLSFLSPFFNLGSKQCQENCSNRSPSLQSLRSGTLLPKGDHF
jgi:hypothetical protein